jgi:hypothetical protein
LGKLGPCFQILDNTEKMSRTITLAFSAAAGIMKMQDKAIVLASGKPFQTSLNIYGKGQEPAV